MEEVIGSIPTRSTNNPNDLASNFCLQSSDFLPLLKRFLFRADELNFVAQRTLNPPFATRLFESKPDRAETGSAQARLRAAWQCPAHIRGGAQD